MHTPPQTHAKRQAALSELAALNSIERGTLREEYREMPSSDGRGILRRGPYFKHQCWENGRNRSVRVPSGQVPQLRADIENGRRFDVLTAHLADLAIAQGRAQRAAETSAPAGIAAKKNSTRNASRKDTARRKPSSRRFVKRSPKKG